MGCGAAFGAATAASYAFSGLVNWPIAGLFVLSAALGGLVGAIIGRRLADGRALKRIFTSLVLATGAFIALDGARLIWLP